MNDMKEIKFKAYDKVGKIMVTWGVLCQTAFNRGGSPLIYRVLMNYSETFILLLQTSLKDGSKQPIHNYDLVMYQGKEWYVMDNEDTGGYELHRSLYCHGENCNLALNCDVAMFCHIIGEYHLKYTG